MAQQNAARVHIKEAMLAFSEFYEDGATNEDGSPSINKASFIIDTEHPDFRDLAENLDKAVSAAGVKEFGTDDVEYSKTPVKCEDEVKTRSGKKPAWMKGKISITTDSLQRPVLLNPAKEEVGINDDLFYDGAVVYGIIEFVAKQSGDNKYLNARLSGVLHRERGKRIERSTAIVATADEFEIDAA